MAPTIFPCCVYKYMFVRACVHVYARLRACKFVKYFSFSFLLWSGIIMYKAIHFRSFTLVLFWLAKQIKVALMTFWILQSHKPLPINGRFWLPWVVYASGDVDQSAENVCEGWEIQCPSLFFFFFFFVCVCVYVFYIYLMSPVSDLTCLSTWIKFCSVLFCSV